MPTDPATPDTTPNTAASGGETPTPVSRSTAMADPDQMRRLLRLPAQARPAWLNDYLGDMTIPDLDESSPNPLLDVIMANTAQGEKNCTLVFPLDQVLANAEHAIAAPHHHRGYEETEDRPCLRWVKDGGTYLMSNGQDPAPSTDTGTKPGTGRRLLPAYAEGWGPDTDPRSILGGDDFCESIDLTRPRADGSTLIALLRAAANGGATRFVMNAKFDDHYMELIYETK